MTEEQNPTNAPSTVKIPWKKTMSEAALAANRANAKKWTGPKTREGKFKSSLNALKHGAYSHNFILKSEDAATFENFSKSFIDGEAVSLNRPACNSAQNLVTSTNSLKPLLPTRSQGLGIFLL